LAVQSAEVGIRGYPPVPLLVVHARAENHAVARQQPVVVQNDEKANHGRRASHDRAWLNQPAVAFIFRLKLIPIARELHASAGLRCFDDSHPDSCSDGKGQSYITPHGPDPSPTWPRVDGSYRGYHYQQPQRGTPYDIPMEVLYLEAGQYLFVEQQQRGSAQAPQVKKVAVLSPYPNQCDRREYKCRFWNQELAEVANR